jgi:hypothetical protein
MRVVDRNEPGSNEPKRSPMPGQPGEVVPTAARRVLERPPSERYAATSVTSVTGDPVTGSIPRAAVGAIVPAAIGGAVLVALASPLALAEPLVAVALIVGLSAGFGARRGGSSGVTRSRRRAVAVAVTLVAIGIAELIVWQLALAQGGVLSFVDYEVQVFGLVAILQPLAAGLAAFASA